MKSVQHWQTAASESLGRSRERRAIAARRRQHVQHAVIAAMVLAALLGAVYVAAIVATVIHH